MTITKREQGTLDAAPRILYTKRDGDSTIAYPLLADSEGKLLVNVEGSGNVTAATCGSVTVASSSTTVLAARADRISAILVNDSTENIYLCYGPTATLNSGIRINSSGGTIIEDKYIGIITAICSSGGRNLTVTEY